MCGNAESVRGNGFGEMCLFCGSGVGDRSCGLRSLKSGFGFADERAGALHDAEEFVDRFGTQHGDTRVAEIRQSLEERCGGKMAANVQNTSVFVNSFNALANLFFQHIQFPINAHSGVITGYYMVYVVIVVKV